MDNLFGLSIFFILRRIFIEEKNYSMKYFKVFNTENEYLEYVSSDEFISPNVSTLYDSTKTWLNAEVHDYSRDYLTFDVLTSGTIVWKALGTGATKTIEYSLNNGSWNTITSTSDGVPITVSQGDSIRFRGLNEKYCEGNKNNYSAFYEGTATYNAKGNIMSLIYGDNFAAATTLTAPWALANVFNHSNAISAENLIMAATTLTNDCYRAMFANSSKLTKAPKILPARTLANECYYYMFDNCISLTEALELPATTLANNCYGCMFNACSSLTEAPELPATTLANYCYYYMFQDCTSLITAPELPATTLATFCYGNMFERCTSLVHAPSSIGSSNATLATNCCTFMFDNCTSLTEAPELPALSMVDYCYRSMFNACSSLSEAPELPATTLANNCYSYMFHSCRSLTEAPELPATTLANECYNNMFNGCASLTTAPELLATTLVSGCYYQMFVYTAVKYVKCLATDISATDCTKEWLRNAQNNSGCTFVKSSTMDDWTRDSSGIPDKWTVHNESYIDVTGVTISASEATVEKGSAYTLSATVLPSNADDKVVSWASSDSNVATVDSNGVVSGVGCGNAIITVTTHDKGYTATCNMSVENHVTSVDLNTYILTLASGNTYQLVAAVSPEDACDKSVTWVSNNTNVATVDSNGVVSGVSTGDATITVTTVDGGFTAQCSVSVTEYTEYTELEYIASTSSGGQYIDLDILLYDELDKWYDIAIKFNLIGSGQGGGTQPTIFGCQDNTGSPWPGTFIRRNNNDVRGRYIGGSGKDNTLGTVGNDIELTPKNAPSRNVYNLNNGGKTHTWGTSLFCIFNNQEKTVFDRFAEAKLYYFKLYLKDDGTSQGTLVRDMMPCKRNSDNAIGLLDKVNNVFYSSPNGAAFVAGPEVNA